MSKPFFSNSLLSILNKEIILISQINAIKVKNKEEERKTKASNTHFAHALPLQKVRLLQSPCEIKTTVPVP